MSPEYAGYDEAVRVLGAALDTADNALARSIIADALGHLTVSERKRLIPQVRPSNEQMAHALLKGLADDLEKAGLALRQSAQALKFAGKGQQANAAILASKAALHAVEPYR